MMWSLATPTCVAPSSISRERRAEHADRRGVRPRIGRAVTLPAGARSAAGTARRCRRRDAPASPQPYPPRSPRLCRALPRSHAENLDTSVMTGFRRTNRRPEALRHRRDDMFGGATVSFVSHVLAACPRNVAAATNVLQLGRRECPCVPRLRRSVGEESSLATLRPRRTTDPTSPGSEVDLGMSASVRPHESAARPPRSRHR